MKTNTLILLLIFYGSCLAQEWQLVGFENQSIISIAIDPKDNNVLYVASGNKIFKTTDGGVQWDTLSFEKNIGEIIINPIHTDTVYAKAAFGVLKSNDAGETWEFFNDGFNFGQFESILCRRISSFI